MKIMSENSSKFAVILEGIKLPQEVEKAIESEIKQVVMKYLALTDLGDGLLTSDFVLPRKWYGIPWAILEGFMPGKDLMAAKVKVQQKIDSMVL